MSEIKDFPPVANFGGVFACARFHIFVFPEGEKRRKNKYDRGIRFCLSRRFFWVVCFCKFKIQY